MGCGRVREGLKIRVRRWKVGWKVTGTRETGAEGHHRERALGLECLWP